MLVWCMNGSVVVRYIGVRTHSAGAGPDRGKTVNETLLYSHGRVLEPSRELKHISTKHRGEMAYVR